MSYQSCLTKTVLASAIATSLGVSLSTYAYAQQQTSKHNIEVITITAPTDKPVNPQDQAVGSSIEPDLASWLTSVPGASINKNGPVTGIAQYRGMYGDRVAVSVDGHTLIGAGPNAMDTPMSYVTPLIVESMSVFRGITPVSASIDTIGGSIDINMRKAQFSDGSKSGFSGEALAGYREQNKAKTFSSWVNMANQDYGLMLFVNSQKGDDYQDGNGDEVLPTRYDKQQAGIDYRIKLDNSEWGISYHYTRTEDSGTPALPMDIGFIKGKRISLDGQFNLSGWQADWLIGHLDAKHGMDNFSMRTNTNADRHRHNYAVADTIDFRLHLKQNQGDNHIAFGIDGYLADHDSTITNPNNMMFNVANFNHVEDDRIGVFAEWQVQHNDIDYSLGARIKHINSDAGAVSHHMQAANMMVANLVSKINDAERSVSDTQVDIAINSQYSYSESTELYAGIGVKQRAPSYQQRYLWMPMEATGGLADGKTYVGNINLDAETDYQLDLGLNYQANDFYISPHVYYQRIDDYIQGIAATDPAVKMMANMMMGDGSPLVFANIDAEIYGMDVRWYANIDQNWRLSGVASYVRGKQRDISDDLYRITPLNAEIALSYQADNWHSKVSLHGFAKQDNVSALSQEKATSGYGLVNWSMSYYLGDSYTLRAGIDNLFNRQYYSHLSGYNRPAGAMNMDMDNGMDMDDNMDNGMNMNDDMTMDNGLSRLPGLGRNAFIELDVKF